MVDEEQSSITVYRPTHDCRQAAVVGNTALVVSFSVCEKSLLYLPIEGMGSTVASVRNLAF